MYLCTLFFQLVAMLHRSYIKKVWLDFERLWFPLYIIRHVQFLYILVRHLNVIVKAA